MSNEKVNIKYKVLWMLLSLFLLYTCSPKPNDTITQFSTIDALLAGVYDGDTTCRQLLHYGDFGIGTFDKLDGEMVVMDGDVLQIKSDGKVYHPNLDTKTPFASVTFFEPEQQLELKSNSNFAEIEQFMDSVLVDMNVFYAFKITGTFTYMKTRSVPAQQKPYKSLADVTKNQPEFTMTNTTGTIIGFRCPPFVKGLNVPGYHLHYVDRDLQKGGHILDFTIQEAQLQLDRIYKFALHLPDIQDFAKVDLQKDRTTELQQVEK